MKKLTSFILVFVFILAYIPRLTFAEEAAGEIKDKSQKIRVGLKYNSTAVTNLTLKSDSGFIIGFKTCSFENNIFQNSVFIKDPIHTSSKIINVIKNSDGSISIAADEETLFEIKPDSEISLDSLRDNSYIGIEAVNGESLSVIYNNPSETRTYNGTILINNKSNDKLKMNVINELPIEQYLYSVVGCEMWPSWNLEALKAQAVTSRTLAYYRKTYFHYNSFDIFETKAGDQEYQGITGTIPKSIIDAVNSTSDKIMYYTGSDKQFNNGQPIEALFSATCGSKTLNSEDVKDIGGSKLKYLPYLRSVDNSIEAYKKVLTLQDIEKSLQVNKRLAGSIRTIVKIGNIVIIPYIDIKIIPTVLSLKSAEKIFKLDSDFTDINTLKISIKDKAVEFNVTRKTQGLGIGMSQYGAQAMAVNGKNYEQILTYYYTDIKIDNVK